MAAPGPMEMPLYSLPLPAFKAAIHERVAKVLPGPSFTLSAEEQAAFTSALQTLQEFLLANANGLASQKLLGQGESFSWKGSNAERRFNAALPILAEASPSGSAPKKAPSMPSVLSAPANMERMVEQTTAAALNLDFLPTFGGPSPPASAGSSPLHPQSQTFHASQPSTLRPPRPGTNSIIGDPLNPFNNEQPSPMARDSANPFNSPQSEANESPKRNPFDTPPREPSAALQPILDKLPDLAFMLSDRMSEPLASTQTAPAVSAMASQPRSSMDKWGDFSSQPAIVREPAPPVAHFTTVLDSWGDFSSQPSSSPAHRAVTKLQPRASIEEWGDFNG